MKHIFLKLGSVFAGLALTVIALNVNTTCMLFVHQPKLPENARKLRQF